MSGSGRKLFECVDYGNLFHRVITKSNIITSGFATSDNITFGDHEMK